LETLVLPITLSDRIRLTVHDERAGSLGVTYGIEELGGSPSIAGRVPTDETNLMVRAAAALSGRVGSHRSVRMSLLKNIPVGGGLGGGSADAAAVLRALNGLLGAALAGETLEEIGAEIGSDVPALLAGGPVLVRGRGERLERVRAAGFTWLLVRFASGVRTPDAFGWWDDDHAATGPDPAAVLRAVAGGDPDELGPLLFNDLEPPVFRRRPDVAEAKRLLVNAGLPGAVMCGSGATVAGLLPGELPADGLRTLRSDLERLTGLSTAMTASPAG
jgi:4-diphosphocytidyl-2-C-methyl-D-erythritol kinase